MQKNISVPQPESPNTYIAPWYGVYSLEQQREKIMADFDSYLSTLGLQHTFQKLIHVKPYTAYRNSNKFTFGYTREALDKQNNDPQLARWAALGFIAGSYPTSYILPCGDAITINDTFKKLCSEIEVITQSSSFKPFMMPPKIKGKRRKAGLDSSYIPHQGVWRYCKVRYSHKQDQYLVLLVNFLRHLSQSQKSEYEIILQQIKNSLLAHEKVAIFAVQEYHRTLEPQPDDPIRILLDRSPDQAGMLSEQIMGYHLLVSPTSFFQVNTAAAEQLYSQIYRLLQKKIATHQNGKKNVLLDMYCGTGSIGITLSSLFDQIIGVDEVNAAIQNAEKNKVINKISNARYVVGRCEDSIPILEKLLGESNYNLYIVVNPSREGLHRKVRRFIKNTSHVSLIYSACNVQTWARDVADLCEAAEKQRSHMALNVEESYIVDLFPHTKHYEVLSSLSKDC
ncbi:MAG: hypothetical protein AAF770_02235 [Bacteroidota bacterium]